MSNTSNQIASTSNLSVASTGSAASAASTSDIAKFETRFQPWSEAMSLAEPDTPVTSANQVPGRVGELVRKALSEAARLTNETGIPADINLAQMDGVIERITELKRDRPEMTEDEYFHLIWDKVFDWDRGAALTWSSNTSLLKRPNACYGQGPTFTDRTTHALVCHKPDFFWQSRDPQSTSDSVLAPKEQQGYWGHCVGEGKAVPVPHNNAHDECKAQGLMYASTCLYHQIALDDDSPSILMFTVNQTEVRFFFVYANKSTSTESRTLPPWILRHQPLPFLTLKMETREGHFFLQGLTNALRVGHQTELARYQGLRLRRLNLELPDVKWWISAASANWTSSRISIESGPSTTENPASTTSIPEIAAQDGHMMSTGTEPQRKVKPLASLKAIVHSKWLILLKEKVFRPSKISGHAGMHPERG